MKTSRLLLLAVFVAGLLTGAGFWVLRSHWDVPQTSAVSQPTGTDPSHPRSVRLYQSPMHPWIRSDRPGRCTICGMELTPVYEGDSGASAEGPVVVLGTNSIQLIHLETSEVSEAPLIRHLRLSGTLEDNDTRHRMISASVAGRIERLSVNRLGQEIRAGDPLLTLYSPSLLAAEREYVALSKQPHPEPAGTSTDLTPILASARQRLIQMGLTPGQIDALKDKSPSALTSELMVPADGTVVLKQVYEGQYVTEGERLFETADFSTMWVQLTAYESDRQWLRVGQSARITTASWNGGVITGQVSFIDPNFDPMTRSTRVRIEIPNPIEATTEGPRRRLLHRVTAMAEIACVETARTLPRSALLWNGGQPVVYLSLGAGAYESRKVRIGRIGDHLAEVLDGLIPGERVVTQAAFLIDAQSQLQSGGSGDSGNSQASSTSRNPSPVPPPLAGFLQHSADLSEALASDQLEVFREILRRFPPHQDALRQWASQPDSSLPETLQKSIASVPVPPASSVPASLAEARKWFLDQSRTTVDLARWAHRQGWEAGVRTFECPMVDRAIPSAPKRAGWLQKNSKVRNPFFGAEMIDCGLELKEKP
ncbi:MAG: efflux RND transporter periplasmic adaptor subunit [Verrucomicrobia bacterium]|nr:efflux RND transporter periplasmic adaptor subunit [Verrucomicrobiota bacterium]